MSGSGAAARSLCGGQHRAFVAELGIQIGRNALPLEPALLTPALLASHVDENGRALGHFDEDLAEGTRAGADAG